MENELVEKANLISSETEFVLSSTYFLIPNWSWIVLAVAFVGGWALRPGLEWILRKVKHSTVTFKEGQSFLHYFLEEYIEKNLSWILISLFWLLVIDALHLPEKGAKYLSIFVQIILAINIIRLLYISADAMGKLLKKLAAQTASSLDDQLAPFATKVVKFLVVVIGFLVAIQNFGVNVVSLLAGLGLGGLALALAAQDTAANVFGSVTILLDSPFKLGDYIKVGDTEGIVEDIGFRSTRIRTFYNSLVTIPNATMAKEKIDNLERRPRRRVRQVLGLVYETPAEKIELFCQTVRSLLEKYEKIPKDSISVFFVNFNAASLDVQVQFHILTTDVTEEQKLSQEIFKEILVQSQKIGVDFAYPTQTVYLRQQQITN